jgi:hypothetical protein
MGVVLLAGSASVLRADVNPAKNAGEMNSPAANFSDSSVVCSTSESDQSKEVGTVSASSASGNSNHEKTESTTNCATLAVSIFGGLAIFGLMLVKPD